MSHGRRTMDRRRRVLYSAHQSDQNPPTAASRREAARLREARKPPAAYGSRVHRRIRARWFSLVPVKRRTMITVGCSVAGIALLLCGAHHGSVSWPAIANHAEIARPLRLDRPDSFGRWFMIAMLTCSAGASLLIYQLRRYRNDDFRGHYRLWRLVLAVLILASVNSVVSIIDWGGALLDAGFGKRVALTGSDWIRLVVSLAGAILAIRLVAEVRHTRVPLGMMVLTCVLLSIPEAAKWNVLEVESLGKWTLVTSAPLLACTTLFIALVAYLRILYREVRQIEGNTSLKQRLQRMRMQMFQRSDPADSQDETDEQFDDAEDDQTRRRWWRRRRRELDNVDNYDEKDEQPDEEEDDDEELVDEPADPDSSMRKQKRRWFGRRGDNTDDVESSEHEDDSATSDESEKPVKKRRRFSMRLAPPPSGDAQDETDAEEPPAEPTKRRGLGGWMKGKKNDASDEKESAAEPAHQEKPQPPAESSDDEEIDPDNIDWSSMSKSERRRLRKKLKRQNRAA